MIVQFLTVFENRYKALGSHKYFLGDTFTMADLYLTVQMSSYQLALKEDVMIPSSVEDYNIELDELSDLMPEIIEGI